MLFLCGLHASNDKANRTDIFSNQAAEDRSMRNVAQNDSTWTK